MEILDEFGWDSVLGVLGDPRGICVPAALEDFFLTSEPDTTNEHPSLEEFPRIHNDHIKQSVLAELSNLSNQILANKASKELVKLEAEHGDRFQSTDLYIEAMGLLARYRYRQPIRRFIFELFDSTYLLEKMTRRHRDSQRRTRKSTGGESRRSHNGSTEELRTRLEHRDSASAENPFILSDLSDTQDDPTQDWLSYVPN